MNSAKFMISKMQTQLISGTNVLLISTCFIDIVNTKYKNIKCEILVPVKLDLIFTAAEHGLRNYATVFPILTLRQLAEKTPLTVEEMTEKVDGLPKAKVNKYGAERFLDITKNYHLIMSSKWQM